MVWTWTTSWPLSWALSWAACLSWSSSRRSWVLRYSSKANALVARDVLPGLFLVIAHVAGQPQDTLAQDVAHHFGSPTFNRVGPHPQEHLVDVGRAHADEVGPDHGVPGGHEHALVAQEVHAQVVDLLVVLGRHELAHGTFGPGRARGSYLRGAHVGH